MLHLTRRTKIQLAIFTVISLSAASLMFFDYMQIPTVFFGVDRYTVTVELPQAGGLYPGGNVTYRGVEVGRVQAVKLTATGAEAVLQLNSDVHIPANLNAQVHSVSAVGEQYVELLPRGGQGPSLKNGDVIPVDRSYVPPDINSLLAATNRGLTVIPRDNLKTVVDESYTAVGGLGQAFPAGQRNGEVGDRQPSEPRRASQPDRWVKAAAGQPDPVSRLGPSLGRTPGDDHLRAAR